MARLTAAQRKRVPASKRGLPEKGTGHGSFPMPNKGHAVAALRLLPRSVHAGNTSPAEASRVRAKAEHMLHPGHFAHQPPRPK